MKKLTIKEYAKKHKLSLFNVMKMAREGAVKTQTDIIEDKEVLYILEDEIQEEEIASQIIHPSQVPADMDIKVEISILKKELQDLRQEVAHLKAQLASK